jgi:hypothetical protein
MECESFTNRLDTLISRIYAACVMEKRCTNPPVEERIESPVSLKASPNSSFYYYWFTNPPALLAGQFG